MALPELILYCVIGFTILAALMVLGIFDLKTHQKMKASALELGCKYSYVKFRPIREYIIFPKFNFIKGTYTGHDLEIYQRAVPFPDWYLFILIDGQQVYQKKIIQSEFLNLNIKDLVDSYIKK